MSPTSVVADGPKLGLFVRIYLTFVVTVVAATLVGAAATWFLVERRSEQWVATTLELLESSNDDLAAEIHDPVALGARVREIGRRAGTDITVFDRRGELVAGEGPRHAPERASRRIRRLERGSPIVRDRPDGGKLILFPLTDPDTGRAVGVVHVQPRPSSPALPIALSIAAVLGLLGLGARSLSHSLRRRLRTLERGAGLIARGDLAHRVELPKAGPRDELDHLAMGFNEMADKVQHLVQGQRILLANVSHELRTPIARIKVQLELLEDRLARLKKGASASDLDHVLRLESGFVDMGRDNAEIEKLISDLLTSGRLELAGEGDNLQRTEFDLRKLLASMADRFGADVEASIAPRVNADSLLLERLLSNLLSNARRACPDGALTISLQRRADLLEIAVEDEGSGIAEADRERVFEPFRRLDAARSRDKGGVGLGLYLCRQIARAHGGTVIADGRSDGRSGARMVVTIPASAAV